MEPRLLDSYRKDGILRRDKFRNSLSDASKLNRERAGTKTRSRALLLSSPLRSSSCNFFLVRNHLLTKYPSGIRLLAIEVLKREKRPFRCLNVEIRKATINSDPGTRIAVLTFRSVGNDSEDEERIPIKVVRPIFSTGAPYR